MDERTVPRPCVADEFLSTSQRSRRVIPPSVVLDGFAEAASGRAMYDPSVTFINRNAFASRDSEVQTLPSLIMNDRRSSSGYIYSPYGPLHTSIQARTGQAQPIIQGVFLQDPCENRLMLPYSASALGPRFVQGVSFSEGQGISDSVAGVHSVSEIAMLPRNRTIAMPRSIDLLQHQPHIATVNGQVASYELENHVAKKGCHESFAGSSTEVKNSPLTKTRLEEVNVQKMSSSSNSPQMPKPDPTKDVLSKKMSQNSPTHRAATENRVAEERRNEQLSTAPPQIVRKRGRPRKKERKRPPKTPDMPKRALSAYNIFFRDERAKILESIPYLQANNDESSTDDNGSTEKVANKDTTENSPEIISSKITPVTNDSGDNAPRSLRLDHPHGKIGFQDLAKRIGNKWQSLSPEQRLPFQKRALLDADRYKEEMKSWRSKNSTKRKKNSDDMMGPAVQSGQTSTEDAVTSMTTLEAIQGT